VPASLLLAVSVLAATPAAHDTLPPGEEGAKARLNTSPRHGEWEDIQTSSHGAPLRTWVVYPERKDTAPVVIVIHEVFGLSDWLRSVADQLAADGFIAVAPDFVSGRGPNGGGSDSVPGRDDVVALVHGLKTEEVEARIDDVRAWASKLKAASGKLATLGFCWGGGQSFAYATHQPELGAAVVFYGTGPELPSLAAVKAPVLGLYGGDDERVGATIPPVAAELKRLGKTYETEIYPGAGHGFLRAQSDRDGANRKATEKAWPRAIDFLRKHVG
jgi:carboxymethylenebutenolidase